MRSLIIILSAVIFCSCSDYNIASLKHVQVNFENLPKEVKEYLVKPSDSIRKGYSELALIDTNDFKTYSLKTVETGFGPWVAYVKLRDNKKNKTYRINHDAPAPFIVFKQRLYIPDRYDIFFVGDLNDVVFTQYQLK